MVSKEDIAFATFHKSTPENPVLMITYDGKIFWHNREVETDDDLRRTMRELVLWFRKANKVEL